VTLAAIGEMLAKTRLIRDNRIIQALNLDGGSSTALYARFGDNEIFSEGRSIVSNYLIVGAAP
jgi:exopolysaccharide biosynthesis protein